MRAHRVLITLLAGAALLAACGGSTAPTLAPTFGPTLAPTLAPTASLAPGQTATPAASATAAGSPGPSATGGLTPAPTLSANTPSPAPTSSSAPTVSPAPTPTLGPPGSPTPVPTPSATPAPTAGPPVIGPASLDAPDSVTADTVFYVNWVGPNNSGDYIAIIAASKRKWTGEPYFYTYGGTPRSLQSSTTPGAYEIRYINGSNSKVLARRPITVTAFVGSLSAAANVPAGAEFNVAWTGPASPSDYVTIEPVGATEWTNESYFYAYGFSHIGRLTAPLPAGNYELWYVAGDKTVMLRVPITVDPLQASVSGPASAAHGATFNVSWTGPNATGDFITIVAVGAPQGSYLSYGYTQYGNPVTLTAPTAPGQYEIRYVYGGANHETLAVATIQIQ